MDQISLCRICLVKDVKMHCINNTKLQEIYEKLTVTSELKKGTNLPNHEMCRWQHISKDKRTIEMETPPFETKDKSLLQVCYICSAKLRNCYQLQVKCLQSEQLFIQLLEDNGLKQTTLKSFNVLKIQHPVINMSIAPEEGTAPTEDNVPEKGASPEKDNAAKEGPDYETIIDGIAVDIKVESITDDVEIKQEPINDLDEFIQQEDLRSMEPNDTTIDIGDISSEDDDRVKQSSGLFDNAPVCKKSKPVVLKKSPDITKSSNFKISGRMAKKIRHNKNMTKVRPYKCDICRKGFTLKQSLNTHSRTHTNPKPYKCDICEECFGFKSQLNAHIFTHTGEKPFKCDVCDKSFIQQCYLKFHSRIHTGPKPYKCNICEERFGGQRDFKTHIRMHKGAKSYKCEICNKSFSHKSHLTTHIRIHTGEKPYKCDICDKGFIQKCDLCRHIRTHTGEKPFKCDICERGFSQKSSLDKHLRVHI